MVKYGDEFRYSTQNACRIRWKLGNGSVFLMETERTFSVQPNKRFKFLDTNMDSIVYITKKC